MSVKQWLSCLAALYGFMLPSASVAGTQKSEGHPSLIPVPAKMDLNEGMFAIKPDTEIVAETTAAVPIAQQLVERLRVVRQREFKLVEGRQKASNSRSIVFTTH